ncbi:MAG: hypothetical protein DWQ07_12840 [Chloroflexi bacterium]|nr:MAG: hypothetical protein DWQ07_12840 [Chloroflexota bacterium]MBL1196926.1 hypothetical protein [Chloroflexota bacterium]NOH14222.1 hypothetical protein [Chloroflexota bacterium]
MRHEEITVEEWGQELKEDHPELYEIYAYLRQAEISEDVRGGPYPKMEARLLVRKHMRKQNVDPDEALPLPANWPLRRGDPLQI